MTLDVLVIDDEPNIRKTLGAYFKSRGHSVTLVSNERDALRESSEKSYDVAFVDIRLGTADGLELIPKLLAHAPWLKIVIITAFATVETAVQAIQKGASEYLPKPFTPDQLDLVTGKLSKIRSLEKKLQSLQSALSDTHPEVDLMTKNPAMGRCIDLARQSAESDVTILIRGESGTGKSVLARAIHSWSKRSGGPFTVVSCPSLSAELLQSELFGHVKGAFTDAVKDNPGRIALSENGTLFLDEIGDLPLSLQPKLLRFIQERQYERVGDPAVRNADVRLIVATNRDLEAMVKEKQFREDLFYRLNVVQIDVPALRNRSEDIQALAENLLAFFSRRYNRHLTGFTQETLQAILRHSWPGNARELRNVIERSVILSKTATIEVETLPFSIDAGLKPVALGDQVTLEKIEEEHIRRIISSTKSLEEASQVLGIDQATLWRRRKEYGI